MKAEHRHHRAGKWLPADPDVHQAWLAELTAETSRRPRPFHPVIHQFEHFIESDADAYILFQQMFEQVPNKPPYNTDPAGGRPVRDCQTMLKLLNAIITSAPEYNRTGVVGVPINAILDWPMGTGAGCAAFLNPKINAHFRNVLDEWARFLKSSDSCAVLNEDPEKGWFGRHAMEDMPNFAKEFVCDPSAPHYGFTSWDDFFTRRFRPGVRPVAEPENDALILNPCESAPYRISARVKERDRFWLKAQRYSLQHMLAGDSLAGDFAGGTVYQAYLSALSYRRCHSPVGGTIVKTRLQPGTYYSEPLAEALDPEGQTDAQAYLTEVATRAMIFIEADNPAIGLICFMPVGMGEVSTCEITVYEGQHVSKGDQLGTFHFGGSTCCLVFRPGVQVAFDLRGQKTGPKSSSIPVCSQLARVGGPVR